ncbi:hypothetical protein AB1Y20_000015 [Prymnesium parvum]|uniref:Sec1-like protein n=1 Tax=Prymnesium parvum TaxID=97485 RepID=A0AB34K790_PRYPA
MFFRPKMTATTVTGQGFSQLQDASSSDPIAPMPALNFGNNPKDTATPSLRDIVRTRLLTDMIHGHSSELAGVVMLVDNFSVKLLSSAMKMSELLDENIQLVENITMKDKDDQYLKRQPLPMMSACYFITPTVESVNRLLFDYRNKKTPMYGPIHLYFTSRLSESLLNKLKVSPCIKQIATFKELNLEFVLTEENVFHLLSPQSLSTLFKPEESPADAEMKRQEHYKLATQLATLCATIGEMPHIRHGTSPVASSVSAVLQEKLDDMAGPGSSFPSRILSDAERPTLLILDRSFDPLSPLLHEFTYQAMVHDLLPVHEDRYAYHYVTNNNAQQTKEVLLNETDPLWKRLRHMHIADLTTVLHAEYKKFLEANKTTANLNKRGGEQDLKAMSEGIKGMPKFQEETARYSLHIHVTSELVRKYNEGSLERIATLEQNMATGEDASKKPFRSALAELKALLSMTDLPMPLSEMDKMRLLMIYVITQEGIKSEERRQLMTLAGIQPEDQLTILALVNLGVAMMQASKRKPTTKKAAAQQDATYDVSRYVPPLKRMMEELFSPGLPVSELPFTRPPTDDAHRSKSAGAHGNAPASGRRLIIFVLGGVTHSEMRSMYEVAKSTGRDIVIGGTEILSPSSYLLGLKQLKKLETLV